jgi:hypothetical protein
LDDFLLLLLANLIIQWVAVRKPHDDGILVGFLGGLDVAAIFYAVNGEKGDLANAKFSVGADNLADRRRVGYGGHLEFRHMRLSAKAQAIVHGSIGRRLDDREFHPFLDSGIAAGRQIHGLAGQILDAKNGRLLIPLPA